MCARLVKNEKVFNVGDKVFVLKLKDGGMDPVHLRWNGCARQETLEQKWNPAIWQPARYLSGYTDPVIVG